MELPPHLIKQVADGKAVLVLGAGASMGAKHPDGKASPSGAGLAKLIADQFLGGQYATEPLSFVSELAISESNLAQVQEFVRDIFEPFSPNDFHLLVKEFKWHGIATVNYDLIVERVYNGKPLQRLAPIISNRDKIEDHLRSPLDLPYLKLHGCINRVTDPDLPLILTTDQYVTHRKNRTRLFNIFSDWGRERTLIFVGMTLGDFDLRAVLLELAEEEKTRPRYYFVTPSVTDQLSRMWETKKVTMIKGTFQEFLQALDRSVTGIARAVPTKPTALPVFARFKEPEPALTEATRLILEHDLWFVDSALHSEIVNPLDFYKGFSQSWGSCQQELDCPREITDDILLEIFLNADLTRDADLVVVTAEAGAGKTVLLRRLAWNAGCDLRCLCLYSKHGVGLSPEALDEISHQIDERLFLFVDDIADFPREVAALLNRARRSKIPLTVVAAERANEWNVTCDELETYVAKRYSLPYLNDKEIKKLIALLEKHRALGTLANQTTEERELSLSKHAGRQLLVALHEATLGKPFEEILRDEYNALTPESVQNVYLTICTLNRTGTPVRAGLISRVHGITFDNFRDEFFKPLEHVVYSQLGHRGYDYEYRARHPHVAELVFEMILNTPEKRYDRYVRILDALNVSYETDRDSLRDMIKAKNLRELFQDHDMIEQLYRLVEDRVPDDGHVFLQHGMYEMKRPNSNDAKAAELLAKANKLLKHNPIVAHAFAELELTRAVKAGNAILRDQYLKNAEQLINESIRKDDKSAHSHHTAFKIEHFKLQILLQTTSDPASEDVIADAIRNAESKLMDGLSAFPDDQYLLTAEADLAKTLADNARAVASLERAVKANLRSPNTVGRLAKTYMQLGEFSKARELLEKAVEAVPFERRLHLLLAQVLMEIGEDGLLVEKHFRKAFIEGDRNFEAQFWYARQLYINGNISEAQSRFDQLKLAPVPPKRKTEARGEWLDGTSPKVFSGQIARLYGVSGNIERDVTADAIYLQGDLSHKLPIERAFRGQRVRFSIAFNYYGAIAQNVSEEIGRT